MFSSSENFYAAWRRRTGAPTALHDRGETPSEHLLQLVWLHQRLCRDRLATADGKAVRILHPGFASIEGGPDFRQAVIQLGDDAPRSGDVEIDLRQSGWHDHGHDRNPNFKSVILQVVWKTEETPAAKRSNRPPALALENTLDAPLSELSRALENESLRSLPENLRGRCCSPLHDLDAAQLVELFCAAARIRLVARAEQFRARARHIGWEQTLWENLFRALGYKHNTWPMQALAESRPQWSRGAGSSFDFQARLLGISGLLPQELTRAQKSSDTYLRHIWDAWWRERDALADYILPKVVWKFHGQRPANHPQRRLALAAHWLAAGDLVPKLEVWCRTDWPDKKLAGSLREILEVKHDTFWSWHWTFRSARMARPQPLLGDARVTDLAVNIILPWLWARATTGNNEDLRSAIERRYFAWPAAEDNSVLKLARQRLLGVGKTRVLRTAATQQGLLQIVRDFCGHSNAVCEQCRFPELVHGWSRDSDSQRS